MRWAALALVLVAGCVSAPDAPGIVAAPQAPADWALRALPFGEQHDHMDLAQHAGLSTPNFAVLGWDPLVDGALGETPGGHFCGDAQTIGDGRRIAAVEQRTIGGFALVDVTDAAAPKWLGELVMRGARVYDLAVMPDGRSVVLATTDELRTPGVPPTLEWRTACGTAVVPTPDAITNTNPTPLSDLDALEEDVIPRPSSIVLVDITDPSAPTITDQRPLAGSGHSVFPTMIDGRVVVLIAALAQENGYYQLYELLDTPLGARLSHLSTFGQDTGNAPTDRTRFEAHDGWIAPHPITGETLAYLAGGRHLTIWDLADLRQPREIGRFSDWAPDRDGFTGHMHSVYPLPEAWGDPQRPCGASGSSPDGCGRHFTLLGPEYGAHPDGQPSGTMWALDTTDPTKPTAVAAWTLPHEAEWSDVYMFSNHYFTAHGRTAFVSMYHGGVWAVDLSPLETSTDFTLLPSVGVFMADRESPAPPSNPLRWRPTAQEVFAFDDGTLVVFDGSSGVYTLSFDEAAPAPAPEPWPILPPP